MGNLPVLGLRAVVVMLLTGSVFVQAVMVPLLAADLDDVGGELAHLRVPVLVILLLGIVTAQVVLVCVWRLVTMVKRGTVFSHAAFRYVHIVIGAMVAAALLVFTLGTLLAPGEAVAPGVVLLLGGVGVAVLGVALVVLVLRMLLAQAAGMRAELEEVI
ncbi:DUF2975 domain-containing protein [Streptomyces sp. NPDC095602]|uniref:DUF2975 domain-containing protein n=1 Tax=Streptomyces sp. NPDC095602 TaxID=3155819 RepID=UPI0033315A01